MSFIRSLLFYLGYFGTLVPHAILCVICGVFIPVKTRYQYFLIWNKFTVWWLKITCGVNYKVSGLENVPPAPYVLLSNHQSPWETIFLYHQFLPVTAIVKKELLKIPFFGWSLNMLHPIAIDRSKKGRALLQVLEQGKKILDEGISVLVFPEGTRVEPGRIKKYSAGGAELAITAGVAILPIAHNAGMFWPAHKFLKNPGTIEVVIGRPVNPDGSNAKEITQKLESWIRQAVKGSSDYSETL